MKTSFRFLCILFGILVSCVSTQQQSSQAQREEPLICRTVRLYPVRQQYDDRIQPAVISLEQTTPLRLEFDLMGEAEPQLYAKIVHYNADWTKSLLQEMEYLEEFNEFPLNDYEYSFDTRKAYTHFQFELPKVTVSGNYKLMVYEEGRPAQTLLEKRFIVFNPKSRIKDLPQTTARALSNYRNQQIAFSVNYGQLAVTQPQSQIKVVIRQNQRWDNALTDLQPTYMQPDRNELEYQPFSEENTFPGGNEFRFFEFKSTDFPGQNVGKINKTPSEITALLFEDRSRGKEVYSQQRQDLNGQYTIVTAEGNVSEYEAEYAEVRFFLQTEKVQGKVYVFGALSNWECNETNRMQYDAQKGYYTTSMLLKQGWYNYMYVVKGKTPFYFFEGSHSQTENMYEIIVYYSPPGGKADQVVGYSRKIINPVE